MYNRMDNYYFPKFHQILICAGTARSEICSLVSIQLSYRFNRAQNKKIEHQDVEFT